MLVMELLGMVSGAMNAGYFLLYRSPFRRRRLGARVLALISLGISGDSLYRLVGRGEPSPPGLLLEASSVLVSLFLLRQLLAGKGIWS